MSLIRAKQRLRGKNAGRGMTVRRNYQLIVGKVGLTTLSALPVVRYATATAAPRHWIMGNFAVAGTFRAELIIFNV